MKQCIKSGCSNAISKNGTKFCSLSCSSSHNAKRGRQKDYTKNCLRNGCGTKFEAVGDTKNKKYCSRSCAAKVNNLGVKRNGSAGTMCERCKKPTHSSSRKFCSRFCYTQIRVDQWLAGKLSACNTYALAGWARKYILEQAGYQCEGIDNRTGLRCEENRMHPKTGNTVLQVDHIDGDWQNCVRQNLRALCPTCHVLTPTYGAGNMGRGRTFKSGYKQYAAKHVV